MTLVLYRRRAFTTKLEVRRAMWRAFDTAVRRKPLAGAADAVYGNSIDFENHCQKRDSAKTLLLMLIDVVVLAFIWIIVARGGLLFKTTVQTTVSNACISRASVRRASGFVLTGSNENGLAHSDAPDLIRQQGVQVWPITLKLFFALLAVAPGAWRLGSFSMRPGPCLLPKTKGGLAAALFAEFTGSGLQRLHILGLPPLGALDHIELHLLTFLQAAESILLNGRKVYKHFIAS